MNNDPIERLAKYAARGAMHYWFYCCTWFPFSDMLMTCFFVALGVAMTFAAEIMFAWDVRNAVEAAAVDRPRCEYGYHVYADGYSRPCTQCGYSTLGD